MHESEDDIYEEFGNRPGGEIDPETQDLYSPERTGTDGYYIDHGTLHCPSDLGDFLSDLSTGLAGASAVAGAFSFGAGAFVLGGLSLATGGLSLIAPSHDHCTPASLGFNPPSS